MANKLFPAGLNLAAILALGGCVAIGHKPPPADWPQLRVEIRKVPGTVVARECAKHIEIPQFINACAIVEFGKNLCTVWVSSDFPDEAVLEHELLHCDGRDHADEDTLARAWASWRSDSDANTRTPAGTPRSDVGRPRSLTGGD
jgi:hypothetical protein